MVGLLILYIIALIMQIVAENSQLSFLAPVSLAILLFGSIIIWYRSGNGVKELGFHRLRGWYKPFLLALFIGILLPIFFMLLLDVFGLLDVKIDDTKVFSFRQMLVSALIMPAFIATAEEVIFRGIYFQRIWVRATLLVPAVFSAVLWGALHLPAMKSSGVSLGQLLLGLATFTAWGSTLSFAFLLTGRSLWAPVGLHYGYNMASSLIGLFLSVSGAGDAFLTGSPGWIPETGFFGLVIWLFLALITGVLVSRKNLLEISTT